MGLYIGSVRKISLMKIKRRGIEMKYKEIIFLQGEEATEVLEILEEEGENVAFQYLLQRDYGESPITEGEFPFGSIDKLFYREHFIMSYNTKVGYIGLIEVT